jgi:hypothetical protein
MDLATEHFKLFKFDAKSRQGSKRVFFHAKRIKQKLFNERRFLLLTTEYDIVALKNNITLP